MSQLLQTQYSRLQLYEQVLDVIHSTSLIFVETRTFFHFEQPDHMHMPTLKYGMLLELQLFFLENEVQVSILKEY